MLYRGRYGSRTSILIFLRKSLKVIIFLILLSLGLSWRSPIPVRAAGVSPTATVVYGQGGNFTTGTANNGGISANSLNSPRRIAVDSSGGLYASEYSNNRVLYYPSGSTTATRVYGQLGSFTTGTANNGGVTADSLNAPKGVAVDSSGGLYITDSGNNRVLYYTSGSTTASRVYGQSGSFTTNGSATSATGLSQPTGVAPDGSGGLFVADAQNNRVLYFPIASTTATKVYGQGGSFTTSTANNGGITSSSLNAPVDVAVDGYYGLYIADSSNNRVVYYPAGSTFATVVYGQGGNFTTNTANNGGISAGSLNQPLGIAVDTSGNLYIADFSNNRILKYQMTLSVTTQPPTNKNVSTAFSTAVSLIDVGSGGVFTDFTGTVTVAIQSGSGTAGATLGGTTSVSAVNGVATFSNLTIDTPGTGYILTFSTTNYGSATSNTFTISGPLTYTPVTLPSFTYTLTGATGTVNSQYVFKVKDTTFSGVGWHTTITSTQFTASGGKTLATTATRITSVSSACTPSTSCVVPTNTVTGYPLTVPSGTTAPTAISFYNATGGTGTGDVTVTVNLAVSIPPGTAAGTYTGVFTVALIKGQ